MCYNEHMETKLCTRCHQELPFPDSFFRDSRGGGGYKAHCKQCDYKIPRSREAILRGQDTRRRKITAADAETAVKLRKQAADYRRTYLAQRRKNDPAYREWKAKKDKEYRQTPQGRARLVRQKARRKAKELGGKLTGAQWTAILEAFKYACAYCGSPDQITVDHFVPLCLGGKTEFANIVPACLHCNSSKQHKRPESWCSPEVYNRVIEVQRLLLDTLHLNR